jgi:hypothetical protein
MLELLKKAVDDMVPVFERDRWPRNLMRTKDEQGWNRLQR